MIQRIVVSRAFHIFLCALLVRLAFVVLWPDLIPVSPDKMSRYDPIARSLLAGEGFEWGGRPTAVSGPVYPGFLALIYGLLGAHVTTLRAVLSLVDAVHCTVFYLLARRYFAGAAPAVTALLLAFCPYLIFVIYVATAEVLYLALHALFLLVLSIALERRNATLHCASGVLLGVAALCRAVCLLMPLFLLPAFLLLYARQWRRGAVHYALFVAGAALAISPWIYRNYVVFERIVPIQTLGGVHLYLATAAPAADQPSSDVQQDQRYYVEAWRNIKSAPGKYLRLMSHRLYEMWFKTHSGKFDRYLPFVNLSLLALAAAGSVMHASRWRHLLPLILTVAYYVAVHSVLVGIFRYMLPAIPIILLFALVPLCAFWQRKSTHGIP